MPVLTGENLKEVVPFIGRRFWQRWEKAPVLRLGNIFDASRLVPEFHRVSFPVLRSAKLGELTSMLPAVTVDIDSSNVKPQIAIAGVESRQENRPMTSMA